MARENNQLIEHHGYCIIERFLTKAQIETVLNMLRHFEPGCTVKEKNGSIYGIRDVLRQVPDLRQLIQDDAIRKLASEVIGNSARMVRAVYFDKTKDANWKVPWHQDCTIAVRDKIEVEGFNLWTVKSGIYHVRPPEEYMKRMITLRIHLDPSDKNNGALKVIPNSHQKKLTDREVIEVVQNKVPVICDVLEGGILMMKPLLVHSSFTGSHPTHRRVLHLEFSPDSLPHGLEWYDAA